MMNIGIQVYVKEPAEKKVNATVIINLGGQFVVRGLKLMTGDNGMFLAMPSYLAGVDENGKNDWKKVFMPKDNATIRRLTNSILEVYKEARSNGTGSARVDVTPEDIPFDVKVSLKEGDTKTKADITLLFDDSFYAEHLQVKYSPNQDKYYVTCPSYISNNGEPKSLMNPVTKEFRAILDAAIIDSYKKAVEMSKGTEI